MYLRGGEGEIVIVNGKTYLFWHNKYVIFIIKVKWPIPGQLTINAIVCAATFRPAARQPAAGR